MILIPNGSSPKNLGDQAILEALLKVLAKSERGTVVLHSYDPELHSKDAPVVRHSLCSWTAFANRNFFVRLFRLAMLVLLLISRGKAMFLLPRELRAIATDYTTANAIVFTGGGYLRSNRGLTQSLNFLLQISMFYWTDICAVKAKKIVGPMSFGPFAYAWQERLAARVLTAMDTVCIRETISLELLQKHGLTNAVPAADLAFLLAPEAGARAAVNRTRIGFTVRAWGSAGETEFFVQKFIRGLAHLAQQRSVEFVPIVQVNAPEYGDVDSDIVENVRAALLSYGLSVRQAVQLHTVKEALGEYGSLSISFAMRMHANILAAVSNTPFVAIAYEHKTQGIARELGLEEFVMPYEQVTPEWLSAAGEQALSRREELARILEREVYAIQQKNIVLWERLLRAS